MIKSYVEVLKETLDQALATDSSVFLFGEDIGDYGGCFGVTRGLIEKYGPSRVIDSPMSEQAITGLGIGAAMNGLKPIIEIMFMDFITLAYDQLLNHAGIFSYLSNGEISVPLVLRVPAGGGRGYGATHSKSLFSPLMHIPGIKIVAPSSPKTVKGLLKAAINENSPVIFVEHKLLYQMKVDVSDSPDFIPLGKAEVLREGSDISLITFSKTVHDCLEVSVEQARKGISVEVIDLQSIKPLDMATIKKSIEKTGKVLIVEEGFATCGVAAEIIAKVNESCFYSLDAPIGRVTTLDVPLPCSPALENQIIPSSKKISKEIERILNE
jgi:acetoin:2,6-dichlorophenolindophenol oxidoreductase subunit beta